MKYKYEDIELNSKVYIKSKTNLDQDLYWTVIRKIQKEYFEVELNENSTNKRTIIHISEISRVISSDNRSE